MRSEEEFCAEGAKFTNIYEGTSNFMKFHENTIRSSWTLFSKIYRIEEAPGPMLAGIGLSRGRFSGISENQYVFFELAKIERFSGSPFSDHFWRRFFENFCIELFLLKN